jgi:polysaccharide biosynthesis protein PslG
MNMAVNTSRFIKAMALGVLACSLMLTTACNASFGGLAAAKEQVSQAAAPAEPAERGINVADSTHVELLNELKFHWIEVFLPPDYPVPPFKILYRVPLENAVSGRLEDVNAWADKLERTARERRGLIQAYAIGNEVNLSREWSGGQPDPLLYTRLLTIAFARIKSGDPGAVVVSAGLAPTGGDGPGHMDDLTYARRMFEAGAANAFDAYGFHPYGFAYPPEQDPNTAQVPGLAFRRAEAHRALMEQFGAGQKQLWATEFGWLINPQEEGVSCAWPDLDWQRVSRAQQADYVKRAFAYAQTNWPWMGAMFLWNYDFSRSPLYPDPCEQMKWFSIVDPSGQPRPVVDALRQ